jgi:hypothetical protein
MLPGLEEWILNQVDDQVGDRISSQIYEPFLEQAKGQADDRIWHYFSEQLLCPIWGRAMQVRSVVISQIEEGSDVADQ